MRSHTVVEEDGTGTLRVRALPADRQTLPALLTGIVEKHWEHIWFGVIVQGAAREVAAPNAPERISRYDGYVTAGGPDLGRKGFKRT